MRVALAAVLLAGFAVFSATVKNELRHEQSPIEGLVVGQPMPDFTLKDRQGHDVALKQVVKDNKFIAINFWASWCGPCRLEMPGFERLYASKHKEGFVILGINEDTKAADREGYLQQKPISFPVLLDDDQALMKQLKIRALPTTILVGSDGRIVQVTEGIQQYLGVFVDMELKKPQKPQ